jgi:DUF1680 family protein
VHKLAIPGPVSPLSQDLGVSLPLGIDAVRLDSAGWLGEWQQRNALATIPHVLDRIENGEGWSNLARLVGKSTAPFRGMFFTDSDVYKALEAVAWAANGGRLSDDLLRRAGELVSLVREAQDDDGYLNSYVQGTPGHDRWSDPHWGHELYTAGHLFQAAVAAARMGVLPELMGVALRFADLLVARFGQGSKPYFDGHPEVETALVELYRLTGRAEYLALASRQLELRGRGWLGEDRFGSQYFQDHLPVLQAREAAGHAVRQIYLLTGAVDVAIETSDHDLLDAVERIWDDLFATKTYVSGAHGSRHRDEALGDAYELPPDRAYAETCAAIASFQWNWRLLLATGRARYADAMETALYNAIAVSTSTDGTEFFYSNPLQLRTGHDGNQEDSPTQRLPWFTCACCPPNISRLLASAHSYLLSRTEQGITVHHYAAAVIDAEVAGGAARMAIRTGYPYDGAIDVDVSGGADAEWELALRIPSWCVSWKLWVDGESFDNGAEDGYARIRRDWSSGAAVRLELEMPIRTIVAHPRVDAVRGCVAIARGPVVYALEQTDLPAGTVLEDVRLVAAIRTRDSDEPRTGPVVIELDLLTERNATGDLYCDHPQVDSSPLFSAMAIPYHRWANRAPGAMRVWLPKA